MGIIADGAVRVLFLERFKALVFGTGFAILLGMKTTSTNTGDGEMTKIVTSATLEGLQKLISEYFYGSRVEIVDWPGNSWRVRNHKGLVDGIVITKTRGRFVASTNKY